MVTLIFLRKEFIFYKFPCCPIKKGKISSNNSNININNKKKAPTVSSSRYLCKDISKGREKYEIPVVNEVRYDISFRN